MSKEHNAMDVVREIDDLIDTHPAIEHFTITFDDAWGYPITIEVHKGMTYAELRKAMQMALDEQKLKRTKSMLSRLFKRGDS